MQCRCSRPVVFCIKGVLENFSKFTGKHLCWSLLSYFLLLKKRFKHSCFPVDFAKFFLKTLNLCQTRNSLFLLKELMCGGFSTPCKLQKSSDGFEGQFKDLGVTCKSKTLFETSIRRLGERGYIVATSRFHF